MNRRSFLKALTALPVVGICFKSLDTAVVADDTINNKYKTIYHLLTKDDFLGCDEWMFASSYSLFYRCPCGQILGANNHAIYGGYKAFRCPKCGCILAHREGDIKCLSNRIFIATEDMIYYHADKIK